MSEEPATTAAAEEHHNDDQHEDPDFTVDLYLSELEKRWRAAKVCIRNRVDALGRPYSPGAVKPKERRPRNEKPIFILCADPVFREQYGNQYLELVDVYRAAKSAWRKTAQITPDGLFAGGFQLPPHTLVGTMPLVD